MTGRPFLRTLAVAASAALLVAALAVPVAAKADATADCKKVGWETLVNADGHAFKNRGRCVSYVVQGGVPLQPDPLEAVCEAAGGSYAIVPFFNEARHECDTSSLSSAAYEAMLQEYSSLCEILPGCTSCSSVTVGTGQLYCSFTTQ